MPPLAAPPVQPPVAPSPLSLCGAFGSLEQRALQKAREHNNKSDPAGARREGDHGDTWNNNNNGEVDLDVDEELEKQVLLLLLLLLLLWWWWWWSILSSRGSRNPSTDGSELAWVIQQT